MRWLLLLVIVHNLHAQTKSVSVAKHIPIIQQLCRAFERDGRMEVVHTLLDRTPIRDPSCPACKPLFMAFESACKPKKIKKGAEVTPIPKQRDPHPEVLRLSGVLTRSIIDDEKHRVSISQAMEKLLLLLAGAFPDRPKAEEEYFSTVHSYMIDGLAEAKAAGKADALPTPSAEHLFGE